MIRLSAWRTIAAGMLVLALPAPGRPDDVLAPSTPGAPPEAESFEQSVRPILQGHCCKCHGGDTQKADLNLSTREGILKGGESGAMLVPGKPEESLLFEMVHDRQMPPNGEQPLTEEQVDAIRRWIAAGASLGQATAPNAKYDEADASWVKLFRLCTLACLAGWGVVGAR